VPTLSAQIKKNLKNKNMYQIAKPLFLICETPLHAGSGSDLGIVDLPIQRERHTSFPKIEASSLKGALREAVEQEVLSKLTKDEKDKYNNIKTVEPELIKLNKVFGFDDGALKGFDKDEMKNLFEEGKTDFAGAIGFTDARLLLFPVKSMKGVFAWVTCPKVLRQFERDMKLTGDKSFSIAGLEKLTNSAENECYILCETSESDLIVGGDKIILEEYAFTATNKDLKVEEKCLSKYFADTFFEINSYWHSKAQKSIVILSDDDFKDFTNLSTEVITRTKISNVTGTVDKENGALFTEEYLPAESVMYSLVMAHDEFSSAADKMTAASIQNFFKENLEPIVQIGGNATLGKGLVRTVFEEITTCEKKTKEQKTEMSNSEN
jgi:CRISPR-associated protein Cmr4